MKKRSDQKIDAVAAMMDAYVAYKHNTDAFESYHIKLVKKDGKIDFIINDLPVFSWQDDGKEYGPVLGGGKIGFRQMAPMIGEYSNLKVYSI